MSDDGNRADAFTAATSHESAAGDGSPRVLHAIVGHKLPIMFLNAIRSVRRAAPLDDLLVVDNDSRLPQLLRELRKLADADSRIHLRLRDSNDLLVNNKVGGLYDAYREVLAYAIAGGYDLLHLMQSDMQMLWWDQEIVTRVLQLYEAYPECVNVYTVALPQHIQLSSELEALEPSVLRFNRYGLTDTGLYHLGKWTEREMAFADSETAHARRYLDLGMSVLYHPWPSVAQIPWPAVVRDGRVKGTEIEPPHELLLRPLTAIDVERVKVAGRPIWLEDICIPWGWICITPMWTTALESIDYWVYRYRDARSRGIRAAWPRWDRRGVDAGDPSPAQRRPALWQLVALPAYHEARRRLGKRAGITH